MAWTLTGGQAILTLRSLIQSDRWQPAWNLLRADFRNKVTVHNTQMALPSAYQQVQPHQPPYATDHLDYAALPLAVCT
jgi:hypothetical protein